jgi:O-acetyl-ADP-ribose deacetylase (regulator of RNase III)
MGRVTKVFISYKTGEDDGLSFSANTIRRFLEDPKNGYKVWMDTMSLKAGEEWDRQIYNEIPRSDVLLLLIAEATAKSNWVAREVDFAKGARVTVLPVQIRAGYDIKPVMERFDLTTVQYLRVLNGTEDELTTIVQAIEELKGKTAISQRVWLDELKRERGAAPFTDKNTSTKEFAVYEVAKPKCKVCVAAGDMFEMTDIDVYVNSENDYMQMARVFENQTVSSMLRFYGSELDDAGRICEDTIQDELNQIIRQEGIRTRPVVIGTVIPTSAGHASSYMCKRLKARYIFHTAIASVEGDDVKKTVVCRLMNSGIQRCVRNTLEKVAEVDRKLGVVSPPDTRQRANQEREKEAGCYKPIKSIILPIFGTGHAGRPADEVLPALIRGVKEFLLDVDRDTQKTAGFHLSEIYIAAYLDEDAKYAWDMLDKDKDFFCPQSPLRPGLPR